MASAQGNGVFLVTQYIPAVNGPPLQQNTHSCQNAGWLQKFIKGEPKSLGVVQIMIGIIHIGLGGVLASGRYTPVTVISGVVFWAPIFFFISGGLSVSAEKNGNRCQVKGALGMSIVSAVVAVIAFIIYAIDLAIEPYYYDLCDNYYSSGSFNFNNYNYYSCLRSYRNARALQVGILAVLLILSLLEFCISISTSAFGCKSVCGDSSSQAGQPVFVVQNAYPQDPRFQPMQTAAGIPITQGTPLMGQGLTMAPGAPMMQGMPTSYIGMMMPGIPSAPEVTSTPIPTLPPSYYKNVPGDAPQTLNEVLPNP